jgi:formylglycine-generating enzyme required for sulfatase activity
LLRGKLPVALAVPKTISLALATIAVASACQIIGGYQSFQSGDGAVPPPPHPCDALGTQPKYDEKGGATLVLVKETTGKCYWIAKTEVTVGQYSRFLAAHNSQAIPWDPDRCAWKDAGSDPVAETSDPCSLTINDPAVQESMPFDNEKPIRCVDWCDAKAFCNWAGKQGNGPSDNTAFSMDLCDGIGVPENWDPFGLPDRWGEACSENAGAAYPYGPPPAVLGNCNVGLGDAGRCLSVVGQLACAPTTVGNFTKCRGPSGTVDMIGNVAEWVIQCGFLLDSGAPAPDSLCQVRGGSFAETLEGEDCYHTSILAQKRHTRDRRIGFRCCADLTVAERRLTGQ